MNLEELKQIRGNNTELISLYISNTDINSVKSMLQSELSQSENIKSKNTRNNVKKAIKNIIRILKPKKFIDNSLVIFSGVVDNNIVSEVYEVEHELINKYHCDNTFLTEPLEQVLMDNKFKVGVITIDRSEACIGLFDGHITILEYIQSQVPSKHSQGGQSAQRFERDIKERTKQFFKKVYNRTKSHFNDIKLDAIYVGGPGLTKKKWVKQTDFVYDKMYTTQYSDENGIKELCDKAVKHIEEEERIKHINIINKFKKNIRNNKSVYGEDVEKYIKQGAVETLLICDNDRLKELAKNYGTEVIEIDNDIEEGKIFCDVFKKGAILRWEIKR